MTTRTKCLVAIHLIAASVVALPVAAYSVDDVLGWDDTTWGMREPQVRRSLESRGLRLVAAQTPPEGPFAHNAPLQTQVEIDDHAYDVALHFSERTRGLIGVLVGTLEESREDALRLRAGLLRALTARYGPPTEAEARGSAMSGAYWTFKTTTIALRPDQQIRVRGHRASQVLVVYSPTTASDDAELRQRLLVLGLLKLLSEGWQR